MVKRIRIALLAALFGVLCLELGERFLPAVTDGFVSTVEAVVGRPLTPVSVAGGGPPDAVQRMYTTAESTSMVAGAATRQFPQPSRAMGYSRP